MSELTNWLDKVHDECDRECKVFGSTEDLQKDPFKAQAHAIAARINWHLRAHDAETREQAKREQMEADCAVVCRRCREGESVCPDDVGEAVHHSLFCNVPCRAWDIRAAYAKAEQEHDERNHD